MNYIRLECFVFVFDIFYSAIKSHKNLTMQQKYQLAAEAHMIGRNTEIKHQMSAQLLFLSPS